VNGVPSFSGGGKAMDKGLQLLAEKIRVLREQSNMTQADLAKKLGLTRSSVNGWEMGLSVPSTPLLVELSKVFNVSADYFLGIEHGATLNITGLTPKEVAVLTDIIKCFHENRS
jgi:transcriptional regulator with XRE-family HTH domain